MKTTRLLLLGSLFLSIFSTYSFSQDTIQALSYYKISGGNSPNTIDMIDSIKNITVQGDSTVFELHSFVRKDFSSKSSFTAMNGQIIKQRKSGWNGNKRHVVFDFNLQESDTFYYNNGNDTFTLLVDSTSFFRLENNRITKAIYLKAAYLEDSKLFGQVVWIEGIGTLREGFDWVLRRIVDGGYTNVLSICNEGSLVYWAGKPEDFDKSCDFNYLDTYLGIEENTNRNMEIGFFPNPSNGALFFKNEMIGLEYQILDLNGKLRSNGTIRKELDIQDLTSGIYFFQIHKDEKYIYERLIVK